LMKSGTRAILERPGVIAQLGERFNGIEEVGGSIPPGSTTGSTQAGQAREPVTAQEPFARR
jgi:hypothetical protein